MTTPAGNSSTAAVSSERSLSLTDGPLESSPTLLPSKEPSNRWTSGFDARFSLLLMRVMASASSWLTLPVATGMSTASAGAASPSARVPTSAKAFTGFDSGGAP